VLQFVLLPAAALAGFVNGGAWSGTIASLTAVAGFVLMAAGALLLGRGLLDLGGNLTPVPRPREDAQLVDSGVYARVRHPMYGGLMLTAVGWGLVAASPLALALAAALVLLFDLKSRREEVWLLERYRGYEDYAARTQRFVPYLY